MAVVGVLGSIIDRNVDSELLPVNLAIFFLWIVFEGIAWRGIPNKGSPESFIILSFKLRHG